MPAARRIDLHGHLLPGLDDGSTSYAESVEIARAMASAGYAHLTCSPHIWPHHAYRPAFILDRVALLQAKLDEAGVAIRLISGGELNLTALDLDAIAARDVPTFGMAGRHVLFDFWADALPDDYWPRVERLQSYGMTAIQAHPERIAAFQLHPELLDELAARGVLLQCNLQCLAEKSGPRMRACAERWLAERRYFALASDVHRLDTLDVRLAGLRRAIALLGEAEVDRLTVTNAAIVAGVTPIA